MTLPTRSEAILSAITLIAMAFYLWALAGCGVNHERVDPGPGSSAVEAKAAKYLALLPQVQDRWGAVDTYQCNSLQRTGLICVAAPGRVDYRGFEDSGKPGRFYRRPTDYPECHANGESRSTISPDELLGLFWCAWVKKDREVLERVWDYGQARGWAMGDDRVGGAHTLMKPRQVALLASLIHKMGGKSHVERLYHAPGYDQCEGFECALQVYEIALRGIVGGGLTNAERGALKQAADRQQRNPLAQAAWHMYSDGDQSRAVELLSDQTLYPEDRLPSSQDRCDPWLLQRDDDSSGYQPCPDQGRTHSGGELLFVSFLLQYRAI